MLSLGEIRDATKPLKARATLGHCMVFASRFCRPLRGLFPSLSLYCFVLFVPCCYLGVFGFELTTRYDSRTILGLIQPSQSGRSQLLSVYLLELQYRVVLEQLGNPGILLELFWRISDPSPCFSPSLRPAVVRRQERDC